MVELRRIISEALDKALDKSFDELKKDLDRMPETYDRMLKATDQRSAGLEQDARQPCLTMEGNVTSDSSQAETRTGENSFPSSVDHEQD